MSGYGAAFPSSHVFSSWALIPSSHCEGQRTPSDPCIPQSCGNTAARHFRCEHGYGDLLSCACHRPSCQLPPADQEPDEDASCTAPDALPEVHRLIIIPFLRCKDICDVPDALRPAQEQIHTVHIADFLAFGVQMHTAGFMLSKIGRQLMAKNKCTDEPCTQAAVEACKLPPAGTGELDLCFGQPALIARNHKSDLPLNPETATEAQQSAQSDCGYSTLQEREL